MSNPLMSSDDLKIALNSLAVYGDLLGISSAIETLQNIFPLEQQEKQIKKYLRVHITNGKPYQVEATRQYIDKNLPHLREEFEKLFVLV